jgi:lysozyme
MLNEKFNRLREMLIRHEGLALKPYLCTAGRLTIGVGRNLDDVGISELEARLMLSNDIARVNMIFNLGISRFKGFKKMIAAIVVGNFERAAEEMLNSKWADQVGPRARELARMMRMGSYFSLR